MSDPQQHRAHSSIEWTDATWNPVTGCTRVSPGRLELRDLAEVERHAREVLRQCEYLRRNGAGDLTRFGLIAHEAWWAWRAAARADRRAAKANDWYALSWRVPHGYGTRDG